MRELRVTADDIGITKENTDTILETVDAGVVRFVSVLPNGVALDYAIEACAMRRGKVQVVLHANLTVGPCISQKEQIPLLVDKSGMFRHSPLSLWRMHLMASASVKAELVRQVGAELRAQFDLVQRTLMARGLALEGANGHQHIHMIPFVFDELISIPGLTAVRITREPFYMMPGSLASLVSVRMLGLVVFRVLSRRNESRAHQKGLVTNSHFLGLLFSGKMTYGSVDAGLRSIHDEGSTEILFHPGSTVLANIAGWCNSSLELKWQCSPWRTRERTLLKTSKLKNLFDSFQENTVTEYERYASIGVISRFIVSGSISALVVLVLLYTLTEWAGLWYLLSATIAFCISIVVSFMLQKFWTFSNPTLSVAPTQFGIFILLNIFNTLVNALGLYILVDYVHLWYLGAEVIVAGGIAFWTFFVMKFVIFKKK